MFGSSLFEETSRRVTFLEEPSKITASIREMRQSWETWGGSTATLAGRTRAPSPEQNEYVRRGQFLMSEVPLYPHHPRAGGYDWDLRSPAPIRLNKINS